MRNTGHQLLPGRCVAGERIDPDGTRHRPPTFEELAEEALRGFRIPALLHQHAEHFPALVDCAPQVHEFTVDLAEHLIEMRRIPRATPLTPQPAGLLRSKAQTP